MLLLTNLDISEKKKLCLIAAKVYLMRRRIEEYFKFKKQQFKLEDLRVMSLQSIRNLNLFATHYALGYATRHVFAGTRSGIKGFLLQKEQSQQLTLAQSFDMGAFG